MRRWTLCLLALTGCAVGAPPGFSDGDLWTFPLVAPLEDDLLLVPVYVADKKQPVLFMIDPDSRSSSIDSALQNELKPYTVQAQDELTEADHQTKVFVAEIPKIKVGDLEVRNVKMRVHDAGTFSAGGRLVRGILGRDVISDSLVLSIDRDRGIAYLAIQGALKPPPGAQLVKLWHYYGRQMAKVKVNGSLSYDMHMDLGARTSMLWPKVLAESKLPRLAVKATLVDEYGHRRDETYGALAAHVEVGAAKADGILVLPFGDERLDDEDIDGALGQNFFAQFNVTMNWHEKKMWLKPRSSDLVGSTKERLRRWGTVFDACGTPACVKVDLVRGEPAVVSAEPGSEQATGDRRQATGDSGPEASGLEKELGPVKEIRIAREGSGVSVTYEVVLEAVDEGGTPLGLPRLLATLEEGVPTVSERQMAADYSAAAAFIVLDVSPFARPCESATDGKKCVFALSRAM